jgi:hypothetical protein
MERLARICAVTQIGTQFSRDVPRGLGARTGALSAPVVPMDYWTVDYSADGAPCLYHPAVRLDDDDVTHGKMKVHCLRNLTRFVYSRAHHRSERSSGYRLCYITEHGRTVARNRYLTERVR